MQVSSVSSSPVARKTLMKGQERWKERQSTYTEEQKTESRNEVAKIVKEYSDHMVERWNKEMDTLLVYVRSSISITV